VGTKCAVSVLEAKDGSDAWRELTHIFPEDVNRAQLFDLPGDAPVKAIKLVFEESSDFFGRITIYDLKILG
jgi:hypothetical protein